MLCVLVACQVLQTLAIGLGAFVVGPPAYALVIESRTFVDPSSQAAFRRLVHDMEVVAHDLNLVEREGSAPSARRLGEDPTPTFHSILDSAGRVVRQVEGLIPVLERAAGALDAAQDPDGGGAALPRLLSDAGNAARRVASLIESGAPAEALLVARDLTSHVGAMVHLVSAPNGSVAPLLQATSRLMPQVSEALNAGSLKRAAGALARTWDKSGKMIDFVARTLNED